MRFIKRSAKAPKKVSLILLDWSVRESFHLLHYLKTQTAGRDSFEVILIEYYSRESEAAKEYANEIDTWVCLEIPEKYYYHKHLMYNAGIALSRGEIISICDSDAMVKEGFINSIAESFEAEANTILHLDQFRNIRRDFYPFGFPSFDELLGDGCINNKNGLTSGLASDVDSIHTRNYGACMCARKDDLIAIGGADEHMDYLGHICGPYEMTFRLVNKGLREVWSDTEFLYHTWHPGQAGVNNYLGPHDGRHISTRALDALISGQVEPSVENDVIRSLREGKVIGDDLLKERLVNRERLPDWMNSEIDNGTISDCADAPRGYLTRHRGFRITNVDKGMEAVPILANEWLEKDVYVNGASLREIKNLIDEMIPARIKLVIKTIYLLHFLKLFSFEIMKRAMRIVMRSPQKSGTNLPGDDKAINFGIYLRTWYRQVKCALDFNAESMYGLAVNLLLLRTGGSNDAPVKTPAVIVGNVLIEYSVLVLRLMALLPKVNIVRIKDKTTSENLLQKLDEGDGTGLIICRDIFIKRHAVLASSEICRKAQIV